MLKGKQNKVKIRMREDKRRRSRKERATKYDTKLTKDFRE